MAIFKNNLLSATVAIFERRLSKDSCSQVCLNLV